MSKLEVEAANSYAILAKLATGGMAELFLARTASTAGVERYVVLKRVLPNRVKDTNFVAMFLDEARLAAQLQHPNIAQVFDTGVLGDSYFFSMEYVHGETVREVIHRATTSGQQVPIGCAMTIIANAAAGLHHAHERLGLDGKPLGIVHRDVSPSNLMVTYEGNVKVVDFGVAKATRRSAETQVGTVKGKIGYLSPEQCRGRESDRRSDLFSLGIIFWELLVGERMYKRENDYDTMESIVLEKPDPPSKLRKGIPKELDAIVMKLLAKAPGDRYQTADEVHEALEAVADQTGNRISNAALKRFVVELFGKRLEPWIEMQARDAAQEVVTVSAAVVGQLDLTSLTAQQLSSIPDLTNTPVAPHRTPTPLSFVAVEGEEHYDGLSEPPRKSISPSHALRSARKVAPKNQGSQTTLRVRSSATRAVLWIGLAGALGAAGVIAWVAFGRGDAAAQAPFGTPATDTVAKADVAQPDTTKPDTTKPDTTKPDTTKPDTTKPDMTKPDTTNPDTTKPDTTKPDAIKVDATNPETGKPDAAKPDTTKRVRPDTKHEKPDRSDHGHDTATRAHSGDDIAANMKAGKFDDVVVSCLIAPKALAQNIASCTLAACEVHDSANARAWYGSVPAKQRDSIIAQCAVAGTMLEAPKVTKPPKPDDTPCDDPMECRK